MATSFSQCLQLRICQENNTMVAEGGSNERGGQDHAAGLRLPPFPISLSTPCRRLKSRHIGLRKQRACAVYPPSLHTSGGANRSLGNLGGRCGGGRLGITRWTDQTWGAAQRKLAVPIQH